MSYIGDIRLGDTIDLKFCTVNTSGAPTTLAGSPTVAAYVGNSTTEITAGITLTVDFDARTGLHNVRVVATGGNGYATASDYQLVLTAGTVGGTSVVGYVIGQFSIEHRSALMPTTGARTLDVTATGEAGIDWANIGSPTTAQTLSGTSTKALEPTTAGRTLDVTATGEAGIDWANIGAPTTVVGLTGTTIKTATDVETDTADIQTRLPGALVSGRMDSSVGAMANSVITATAIATDAITAAKIAADAIGASELAADAVAEIADQVWDEVLAGHLTGGSTGAALNAAGSAGDPWGTALPGAYVAGSAGYILGTNLDAKVSEAGGAAPGVYTGLYNAITNTQADSDPGAGNLRWNNATQTSATFLYLDIVTDDGRDVSAFLATIPSGAEVVIQARTNAAQNQHFRMTGASVDGTGYYKLPVSFLIAEGADFSLNDNLTVAVMIPAASSAEIADAVWDEAIAGHVGAGSTGVTLNTRASQTSVDTIDDFLDTEIAAIKAKTDQLTFTTANQVDAQALSIAANAITATAIAADAIGASELAADAVTEIADGILKRDMSAVSGEASRSMLNALRFLRNKWSIAGSTLTVTKEDDSTSAWTSALTTNAAAEPITASDPA